MKRANHQRIIAHAPQVEQKQDYAGIYRIHETKTGKKDKFKHTVIEFQRNKARGKLLKCLEKNTGHLEITD